MDAWWVAASGPLKKIFIVGGPAGLGLKLVTRAKAGSAALLRQSDSAAQDSARLRRIAAQD